MLLHSKARLEKLLQCAHAALGSAASLQTFILPKPASSELVGSHTSLMTCQSMTLPVQHLGSQQARLGLAMPLISFAQVSSYLTCICAYT